MFGAVADSPLVMRMQDYFQGKPVVPRSPQWPKVRRLWLANHNFCAVCGCTTSLNVHHIRPFHEFPELELEPSNFITLGEVCHTGNHHLLFGHLGDWRSWNAFVVEMSDRFYQLILTRPYTIKAI